MLACVCVPLHAIGYVSLENSDYAEFKRQGSFNRCNGIVILPGELPTSLNFSAARCSSTGVLGSMSALCLPIENMVGVVPYTFQYPLEPSHRLSADAREKLGKLISLPEGLVLKPSWKLCSRPCGRQTLGPLIGFYMWMLMSPILASLPPAMVLGGVATGSPHGCDQSMLI